MSDKAPVINLIVMHACKYVEAVRETNEVAVTDVEVASLGIGGAAMLAQLEDMAQWLQNCLIGLRTI